MERDKRLLESKKARLAMLGMAAVIVVMGIAAMVPEAVPAAGGAFLALGAIVTAAVGGQAAVDYRRQGTSVQATVDARDGAP